VRTRLARDLPPLSGDRVQLQQLLLNLIMNAVEAMSSAEERVREIVVTTGRTEGGELLVSVYDTGIGLDAGSRDIIFDAFQTTKSMGMGMGLAISRSIVEHHGGRLWATSNDATGSTFSFTLPLDNPVSPAQ
jgi:signal transduction histidine kinase